MSRASRVRVDPDDLCPSCGHSLRYYCARIERCIAWVGHECGCDCFAGAQLSFPFRGEPKIFAGIDPAINAE